MNDNVIVAILVAIIGTGAAAFGIWQESFAAFVFMFIALCILSGVDK